MNGKRIKCGRCEGHGLRAVWSFGVKEPDECPDCGGSGVNWQYGGGQSQNIIRVRSYAARLNTPKGRAER